MNEYCPRCDEPAERQFAPRRLHLSGTRVTHAEYNPAFGEVVKNKHHRQELAKRLGVVEVGNDFKSGEKMDKQFEKDRVAKLERRWDDV